MFFPLALKLELGTSEDTATGQDHPGGTGRGQAARSRHRGGGCEPGRDRTGYAGE